MDHGVTVDFYWKLQQKGQATVAYTARAESWKLSSKIRSKQRHKVSRILIQITNDLGLQFEYLGSMQYPFPKFLHWRNQPLTEDLVHERIQTIHGIGLKLYPTHTLPWTIKDLVTGMLVKLHFLRILICSTYYQQHRRSSPLKHNARWVKMIADRRISYRVQLCDSARKNLESLRNSSVWSCSQTYSASRVTLNLPRQFYVGRAKETPLALCRIYSQGWSQTAQHSNSNRVKHIN